MAGFTDRANKSAAVAEAKTILTAYSTLVAENPNVVLADVSDDDLEVLTGDLDGEISNQVNNKGKISFTYTKGTITITCTDGQLGDPEES